MKTVNLNDIKLGMVLRHPNIEGFNGEPQEVVEIYDFESDREVFFNNGGYACASKDEEDGEFPEDENLEFELIQEKGNIIKRWEEVKAQRIETFFEVVLFIESILSRLEHYKVLCKEDKDGMLHYRYLVGEEKAISIMLKGEDLEAFIGTDRGLDSSYKVPLDLSEGDLCIERRRRLRELVNNTLDYKNNIRKFYVDYCKLYKEVNNEY